MVEGLCKYSCMLGGGAGGLVVLVLMANSSLQNRLAFVAYILPVGLLSLLAVPVFCEVQPAPAAAAMGAKGEGPGESAGALADAGSLFGVLQEAVPWPSCRRAGRQPNAAMQHLLALKFWHGAYGASIASMLLYYVTYVLKLSSWLRLQVIAGAGMAAGATEVVMNLAYMRLFATGDSRSDASGKADRSLLMVTVVMRLVNAVCTVAIVGVATPSVPLLFIWSVASRASLCSFSFWRVSAQCWLVDEDCLLGAVPGRKREGTLFGALAMTQNFAAAAFTSLTFLGLGISGLSTRNCEAWCREVEGDASSCVDECFRQKIEEQPDSLRLYIRAVIGLWAPLCELLIAFHAYHFPIKGARLRRLYLAVAESRGESTGVKTQTCCHQAASRIVLRVEATEWSEPLSWMGRLAHTADLVDRWPGSKSHAVLFDVVDPGHDSEEASKSKEPSIAGVRAAWIRGAMPERKVAVKE